MAATQINVGVIGYGLSAKVFHIPFIQTTPSLTLHSIVQRNPQPSLSAPADHPSLAHYRSSSDLLADPAVQLVVITTPPDTHYQLARDALVAGKHVLVEKPFVPTSAQADELAALSRQTGRLVCVYQNRRWDGDYLLATKLVKEGTLGRVLAVHTHFDRFKSASSIADTWKTSLPASRGGGALFDLGTHLIDQAYVLFGMPLSARGRLLSQRRAVADAEHPDAATAELLYPGGMVVHVEISQMSVEQRQPRFWLRGDKASFRSLKLDPQEDQLKGGMSPAHRDFGALVREDMTLTVLREETPVEVPLPDFEPATYRAFYGGLAKALQTGRREDVPVKPEEAADVLRIIEAVTESARTGADVPLKRE